MIKFEKNIYFSLAVLILAVFLFLFQIEITFPGLAINIPQVQAQTICQVGPATGNDTNQIQLAINNCAGGGEVRLRDGQTYTAGMIEIKSGVTLNLNGARLVASPNPSDYTPYGPKGRRRFIVISGVSNVTIKGPGTIQIAPNDSAYATIIDVGGPSGGNNLTFNNFTIDTRMGPSHHRNSHFGIGRSTNVTIENISIFGRRDSGSGGNDGLNIETSRNVQVKNCHINTDDVALTFGAEEGNPLLDVTVENCRLSSARTGMTFGTDVKNHELRNITLRNIEIYNTGEKYGNRGVKFEMFFGGVLENVKFIDFTFTNVGTHFGCSVGQLRYPDWVVGKCIDDQSTARNICMEGFSSVDVDFVRQNLTSNVSTNCDKSGGSGNGGSTADLNSDGKVDVVDLGIFLSNWGKTTKPPADINQDGKVDVIDFGILLSNWG